MHWMCGMVILVLASAVDMLPHQESGVKKAQYKAQVISAGCLARLGLTAAEFDTCMGTTHTRAHTHTHAWIQRFKMGFKNISLLTTQVQTAQNMFRFIYWRIIC